ncbi:MAG: phage holin family protein [Peptococcaceae bacterium]|nr:phage holin family protein [Peptococcaceae bacterium]
MLVTWLINSITVLLVSYLLKGFHVENFATALIFALLLGVINSVVRPVALFFGLPITILTLGLFVFVINAAMLKLAGALVSGVRINGWGTAILASLLISIIASLLNSLR